MKLRSIATAIIAPLVIGGAVLATTGAASAATMPTYTAKTQLNDRPDSGGNGNWANDWFKRTYKMELAGTTGSGTSTVYYWKASILDNGTFDATKGAFTPNQGADNGKTINAAVDGSMWGWAQFSFTTNTMPNTAANLGEPTVINGSGGSTSTWYEAAFPAGTVFGGSGIGTWGWYYHGPWIVTYDASGKHVLNYFQEHWTDASWNSAGQLTGSGDITGFGI